MKCLLLPVVCLAFAMGCDKPPATGTTANNTPAKPAPAHTGEMQPPQPPGPVQPKTAKAGPTPIVPGEVMKEAEAGVGEKGRGYGGGILTEPIRVKFLVDQRAQFILIEQALSLYKAEKGELPKTHQEFMKKIIEANRIKLPELPAGDEYVYDPAEGKLMVREGQAAPAP